MGFTNSTRQSCRTYRKYQIWILVSVAENGFQQWEFAINLSETGHLCSSSVSETISIRSMRTASIKHPTLCLNTSNDGIDMYAIENNS